MRVVELQPDDRAVGADADSSVPPSVLRKAAAVLTIASSIAGLRCASRTSQRAVDLNSRAGTDGAPTGAPTRSGAPREQRRVIELALVEGDPLPEQTDLEAARDGLLRANADQPEALVGLLALDPIADRVWLLAHGLDDDDEEEPDA